MTSSALVLLLTKMYYLVDIYRVHDYDEFISTFLAMLAEQGHLGDLLEHALNVKKKAEEGTGGGGSGSSNGASAGAGGGGSGSSVSNGKDSHAENGKQAKSATSKHASKKVQKDAKTKAKLKNLKMKAKKKK